MTDVRGKRPTRPVGRDMWSAQAVFGFVAAKAIRVASVGLVLGALAGWIGLLSGGTASAVGAQAARWYPLMVFALPAALIVTTFSDLSRALAVRRPAGPTGLVVGGALIATGIGGAILGTAYFLVLTFYIPTIFSFFRLDPIAIRAAVLSQFDWPMAGIVLAVTIATGVVETIALLIRATRRRS
ncbi:MAG: hypothetical protein ACRDIY_21270 [Chloroflexota bacterium]